MEAKVEEVKRNKHAVHYSSKSANWETPDNLFKELSEKYGPFDLDAAATNRNKKCRRAILFPKQDALKLDWSKLGRRVWLNPPYGRGITGKWVNKAFETSQDGSEVCCLLPARTDTRFFHNFIWSSVHSRPWEWVKALEFLKGRVKFKGKKRWDKKKKKWVRDSAPFPSMVVVFQKAS